MIIKEAKFVVSSTEVEKCPQKDLPEYAFIGRSNVGKSSLINMLVNIKGLAKTSGKPGKTRLINHFLINNEWYLVDLPGYGFAKVSKTEREKWVIFIRKYFTQRKNLYCTFVLVDIRLTPQPIDLEFMEWLGNNQLPFAIVFTKADKLNEKQQNDAVEAYRQELLKSWEETPQIFVSSAQTANGREGILNFIEEVNNN
jgi:GTP-binding protein